MPVHLPGAPTPAATKFGRPDPSAQVEGLRRALGFSYTFLCTLRACRAPARELATRGAAFGGMQRPHPHVHCSKPRRPSKDPSAGRGPDPGLFPGWKHQAQALFGAPVSPGLDSGRAPPRPRSGESGNGASDLWRSALNLSITQ